MSLVASIVSTAIDGAGRNGGDDELQAIPGHDVVVVAGLSQLSVLTLLVQPSILSLEQGGAGLQAVDRVDGRHGWQRLEQLGGVCVGGGGRGGYLVASFFFVQALSVFYLSSAFF